MDGEAVALVVDLKYNTPSMAIHYNTATYLLSAPTMTDLPADEGCEIAFIGRSNAGKSSAINTITGIKGLARTSKNPGRTQMLNLFGLDNKNRLVDLPGYGYAKVPLKLQEQWHKEVNTYLKKRRCLRALILIMDVRHPLKDSDQELIEWAVVCNVRLHILLTKSDKLSRGAAKNTLQSVKQNLLHYGDTVTVQLFSSHDRTGVTEAHDYLNQVLNG